MDNNGRRQLPAYLRACRSAGAVYLRETKNLQETLALEGITHCGFFKGCSFYKPITDFIVPAPSLPGNAPLFRLTKKILPAAPVRPASGN
jgi:hypothetical protein